MSREEALTKETPSIDRLIAEGEEGISNGIEKMKKIAAKETKAMRERGEGPGITRALVCMAKGDMGPLKMVIGSMLPAVIGDKIAPDLSCSEILKYTLEEFTEKIEDLDIKLSDTEEEIQRIVTSIEVKQKERDSFDETYTTLSPKADELSSKIERLEKEYDDVTSKNTERTSKEFQERLDQLIHLREKYRNVRGKRDRAKRRYNSVCNELDYLQAMHKNAAIALENSREVYETLCQKKEEIEPNIKTQITYTELNEAAVACLSVLDDAREIANISLQAMVEVAEGLTNVSGKINQPFYARETIALLMEGARRMEAMKNLGQEMSAAESQEMGFTKAYGILGLPFGAAEEDVERRYRALVMEHHPDHGGNTEEFDQIQRARDILTKGKK